MVKVIDDLDNGGPAGHVVMPDCELDVHGDATVKGVPVDMSKVRVDLGCFALASHGYNTEDFDHNTGIVESAEDECGSRIMVVPDGLFKV